MDLNVNKETFEETLAVDMKKLSGNSGKPCFIEEAKKYRKQVCSLQEIELISKELGCSKGHISKIKKSLANDSDGNIQKTLRNKRKFPLMQPQRLHKEIDISIV